MPRQLPWVRRATKHQPQLAKPPFASNIDDNSFDGTILSTDAKGKGKAISLQSSSDSGDHHSRTSRNPRKRRALSSSPPVAQLSAPPTDNMRTALSRFDLGDDEWMMVENELLETAKLFTHHLHLEEYEILQESIERKKKGINFLPAAARPVVVGAGLSAEGALTKRAKVQNERQRRAFRDVFTSRNEDNESQPSACTEVAGMPSKTLASGDTDSNDLDMPLRPPRPTASRATALDSLSSTPLTSNSSRPRAANLTNPPLTKFALAPRAIAPRLKNSRIHRATPFDMLDDYVPKDDRSAVATTTERQGQRTLTTKTPLPPTSCDKPSRLPSISRKSRKSVQLLEEWDTEKSYGGSEVANGIQGRPEKEKGSGKHKAADVGDDIPTFLL